MTDADALCNNPLPGDDRFAIRYTLADIEAAQAAGAEAMREACAVVAAEYEADGSFGTPHAIAKIPLPAPETLARVIAEAEARGMERAACSIEDHDPNLADFIRAAAKEIKP